MKKSKQVKLIKAKIRAKQNALKAPSTALTIAKAGGFTNAVRRVLNRELETKFTANVVQPVGFNSTITSFTTEAYSLMPPVVVATLPNQTYARVGNQISPMSLKTTLFVGLSAVNRSLAIRVDVYVLTRKDLKYWPDISTDSGSVDLFQAGNSVATVGYNGFMNTTALRYNLNKFTVLKHKQFILTGNVGVPNGDTTSGNAPNVSVGGCAKKIVFDLDVPKTLKYDEDGGTYVYPNNYAPFMVIGYSKVEGAAPDTTYQSVQAQWTSALTFKDA